MARWRILVVDDEDDIRFLIRGSLASKYEIIEAHDGVDALAKLEIAEPDFVILDVMMPLMDGIQTCEAIRRHPKYSAVSVMFLSALNSKDDIKKGYGAGANLYLTKPFDPSRLLKNVDFYFDNTPPPMRHKRFTLPELMALQKADVEDVARAHASIGWKQHAAPSAPVPPASATPRPAPPAAPQQSSAPSAPAPRPAPAPASSAPSSSSQAPVGSSSAKLNVANSGLPRILVVDDEIDILTISRSILDGKYEVVTAHDGMEAIEKITLYQPDILMIDAMMPRMSGYQLVQTLRRNARFAKLPVLFVSAKATPRDREYALRIGASEFLGKPFMPDQLLDLIAKFVSSPGFSVYPKSMSVAQINDDEFARVEAAKKQEQQRAERTVKKEESELEKFLREVGDA